MGNAGFLLPFFVVVAPAKGRAKKKRCDAPPCIMSCRFSPPPPSPPPPRFLLGCDPKQLLHIAASRALVVSCRGSSVLLLFFFLRRHTWRRASRYLLYTGICRTGPISCDLMQKRKKTRPRVHTIRNKDTGQRLSVSSLVSLDVEVRQRVSVCVCVRARARRPLFTCLCAIVCRSEGGR